MKNLILILKNKCFVICFVRDIEQNVINKLNVSGIYVKIVGRAYCRWTTGSKDNKKTHIGEEYYLNNKTFFCGGDSGTVYTFNIKHFFDVLCMT